MHLKSNLGNLVILITYRFTNHISFELIQDLEEEEDVDDEGEEEEEQNEDWNHY